MLNDKIIIYTFLPSQRQIFQAIRVKLTRTRVNKFLELPKQNYFAITQIARKIGIL